MTDSPLEQMAARLLREARTRAGLTQVQLAARAGVTQSVISAYESARRQPSMPMLVDLVRATGMQLAIQVEPVPGHALDRLTGPLGRRVRERREELVRVAAEHGLTNLELFGSTARGEDGPTSDVDLLADVPAEMGMLGLGRAREAFEAILDAPVDIIFRRSLAPDVAEEIAPDLVPL